MPLNDSLKITGAERCKPGHDIQTWRREEEYKAVFTDRRPVLQNLLQRRSCLDCIQSEALGIASGVEVPVCPVLHWGVLRRHDHARHLGEVDALHSEVVHCLVEFEEHGGALMGL
ncbi:hypothetical protein QFZ98_000006 [Paraburkholderia youngii]